MITNFIIITTQVRNCGRVIFKRDALLSQILQKVDMVNLLPKRNAKATIDMLTKDRSFDISICINVIHHIHITDFEKALKELSRISDKYLILEIRNKKNIFNFWYKYFALPVLYKNLPVYSCSITEVNNVLKNQKFNLEMAKGIYSRKWLCRRLLLIFRRINVNRY